METFKVNFRNFIYSSKIIYAASKKYFILNAVFSLLNAIIVYIPLLFWRQLINAIITAFEGNFDKSLKQVCFITVCYCAVVLIKQCFDVASQFIIYKYNDAIEYYLDNVMIDKISSIDLAFFDSSELQDKLNNSWMLIYSTKKMVSFVFDIIQHIFRLTISAILLINLNYWILPMILLLCIPSIIGDKKISDIEYKFEKKNVNLIRKREYYKSVFFDSSRQEIRLYDLTNYFTSMYECVWKQWDKIIHANNIKICVINIISLLMLVINEVIIYFMALMKLVAGQILVGDVAYYVSVSAQFRMDFSNFCSRINDFIKSAKELKDARDFVEMKPLIEHGGKLEPTPNPIIEFKNVYFKYPNSNEYVLRDCSFIINPGEIVGLVGLNGSGKSTIIKLLCRFYDPTDGLILIDGIDSKEYDIVKLRELFGVLFQDYVRYSFSLRENIALSDLTKMDNERSIFEACIASKVYDYIADWEKGIDENLTRRFDPEGKELSGGQWQRIALARVFLRNAPIVLLDEPSSALDPVAEHEVFENFAKVAQNRSAVLISHRLSSIALCGKILVLKNGNIVEQGSHSELMSLGGEYSKLFELQSSKYYLNN